MVEKDFHHLMYFPERVTCWLQGKQPMPLTMEIGLTSQCNYRCRYCALDWVARSHTMDTEVAKKVLKDAGGMGVRSVHFAGEGEPMLHPEFFSIVTHAKNAVDLEVGITTNGSVLNSLSDDHLWRLNQLATWIRISMDAGTQEEYKSIHGVNRFSDVVCGIKRLAKHPILSKYRRAKITLQAVSIGQELIPLIELGRKLQVDHVVIKPYSPHPHSPKDITPGPIPLSSADGFLIGRHRAEAALTDERAYTNCWANAFFILVAASGDVLPCNLYYDRPEMAYGNVNTEPLYSIWGKSHPEEVTSACRPGCRLHEANTYLDRVRNPRLEDFFL